MAKQHEQAAQQARLIDSYGAHGLAQMVIDLTAELEELQDKKDTPDWVKVGDGTLHGAIDYWQERCRVVEAERDAQAQKTSPSVPDGWTIRPDGDAYVVTKNGACFCVTDENHQHISGVILHNLVNDILNATQKPQES